MLAEIQDEVVLDYIQMPIGTVAEIPALVEYMRANYELLIERFVSMEMLESGSNSVNHIICGVF